MESFVVTCETCHARLRIRSENLIGQIHACPKCESMVHIVPPLGWIANVAPVEPIAAQAAGEKAPQQTKLAAGSATMLRAGVPVLVWGFGGAAILLVVVVIAVLLSRGGDFREPPLPLVAVTNQSEPAPKVVAETELVDNTTEDAAAAVVTAESSPSETAAEVPAPSVEAAAKSPTIDAVGETPTDVEQVAAEMPELPADDVVEVAVAEAPVSDVPDGVDEPATEDQSSQPTPAAVVPEPVLKFDPLDFDPSQLSLGASNREARPAESDSAVIAGPLESGVTEPAEIANDDSPDDQGVPEPGGDPAVYVRIGPSATEALRRRDVARQFSIPIESFEMDGLPLVRVVQAVSEIADVPITIEPEALVMTGVSPRAEVALATRDTTLQKLLDDVLVKQRLGFVERDGQLVVVQPAAERRRTIEYDVSDLVEAGADDASGIVKLVRQFVEPDAWATDGKIDAAGMKLRVEAASRLHAQVMIFCERLRLARGLTPRSRYPSRLLSVEPPYAKILKSFEKSTTFTFLPWTRLADVVRHCEESTGVTMLVDWTALAKEELAPSTPIACSAIGKPWGEALDAVLEPLGLAWWAVDGETIQITSKVALDEITRVEFFAVPKELGEQFADGEAIVSILQKELRENVDASKGNTASPARMEIDAPSGRLVVRASPQVHRYLTGRLRDAMK